jgi:uncharacterized protein YkwD
MTAYRRGLAICLAVTALLSWTVNPVYADSSVPAAEIRDRLEASINRDRAEHDLRRLRVSLYIQRRARSHAIHMANGDGIYHDSQVRSEVPDGATAWAENVGRTTAQAVARRLHRAFMNSPSHRANILSGRMTHMGIGVAKGGNYTYVTERFADLN